MRKTSYCKLSTILCLVFLHVIFCSSISYAGNDGNTGNTGEKRTAGELSEGQPEQKKSRSDDGTDPDMELDRSPNGRASEIIDILDRSLRLNGQILADAKVLIGDQNVDIDLQVRLATLMLRSGLIDLGDQRRVNPPIRTRDFYAEARANQEYLVRSQEALLLPNLGYQEQIKQIEKLIINKEADKNLRAELAVQMIDADLNFGSRGFDKAKNMAIDHNVDLDLRARLVIGILEQYFRSSCRDKIGDCDKVLIEARELIIDRNIHPDSYVRLAILLIERNLLGLIDLNNPGLVNTLKDLVVNPNVDPDNRARLATLMLERELSDYQRLVELFQELVVNPNVAPDNRARLAIAMRHRSLGRQGLVGVIEMIQNENICPDNYVRLAILTLEEDLYGLYNQNRVILLQELIIEREIDPNDRARLAILMLERGLLNLGELVGRNSQPRGIIFPRFEEDRQPLNILQGFIERQDLDLNDRTRLANLIANQILDRELINRIPGEIGSFNIDDHGWAEFVKRLIRNPNVDPNTRIRLAIRMLERGFSYYYEQFPEMTGNLSVRQNLLAVLAIQTLERGLGRRGLELQVVNSFLALIRNTQQVSPNNRARLATLMLEEERLELYGLDEALINLIGDPSVNPNNRARLIIQMRERNIPLGPEGLDHVRNLINIRENFDLGLFARVLEIYLRGPNADPGVRIDLARQLLNVGNRVQIGAMMDRCQH